MNLPTPLILVQKRPRLLRLALTGLYILFLLQAVGGMIVAVATGILWLILLAMLIGVSVIVFCLYLLKMNRDPELVLTDRGFSERTETDFRQFNWPDVEQFQVYSFQAPQRPPTTRVGFSFSSSFRQSSAFKKVRLSARTERRLTGYDWHLSNFYGKSAEGLAKLMNQYRQQYGHES